VAGDGTKGMGVQRGCCLRGTAVLSMKPLASYGGHVEDPLCRPERERSAKMAENWFIRTIYPLKFSVAVLSVFS
jgi:hypothetical protein